MTQKKDQVTAHVQLGGMINYIPCSVEVGEVTTLPAGSDATVTNSGNEHEIVLDFGLPKGDKGDQGEQGDTGKSAYEYAVEQGYEGTEEDFGESLTTIDTKAAQAASAAGAASLSANNANVYATAANNSAAGAAQSAANAADSEQNAATSAASAQSHAVNAANSALLAGQAVTSANASASAAATQAANAAASATNAAQMASAASTSASAASASADTASAVLEDPNFVAVAGAKEDIATVASSVSDIGTVAGISEDVSKVADNSADISAVAADLDNIDEVATKVAEWTPPSDWVDIRSGALNNSIYVLVGHAADYSQYAKFSFIANTSTSGNTYDVYVDGIKQTTTASGTATTLDWQTLALDSGYDVTHPSALRTHIVRITPTQSTDTFTRFRIYDISGQRDQGLLWLHFELSNPIQIANLCATDTSVRNFLLQAVTAKNDNITYTVNSNSVNSGFYGAFRSCTSLKKIPVLTAESTQYASGTYISFIDVPLKKVIIKNNSGREELRLINSAKTQEFDIENGVILSSASSGITDAHGAVNLKKLPSINASDAATFQAHGLTSLQDTFVDDSSNSSRKLFRFYGTGAEPVRGLKGLVVSNEAPFYGESPQINVAYTGLDRQALRQLFKSMPTVSANQVCNITGATGAADLTAEDLAIATDKDWTVTR